MISPQRTAELDIDKRLKDAAEAFDFGVRTAIRKIDQMEDKPRARKLMKMLSDHVNQTLAEIDRILAKGQEGR